MTVFVGLDLAWGDKNDSGLCIVDGDRVEISCWRGEVEELAEMLTGLGADVVAGVDAPLIVGQGRRAEAELARRMGRYGVYAHSSAAAVRNGYDRGLRLARLLDARGFSLDPRHFGAGTRGRFAFEVYPHAGHVVLFGLDGLIRYKQKKGRTAASLNVALGEYRTRLLGWSAQAEWPAAMAANAWQEVAGQKAYLAGKARKRHEDQLDAMTCAALAYLAWRDGLCSCEVVGEADQGYIVVPGLHSDRRFSPHPPGPFPTMEGE